MASAMATKLSVAPEEPPTPKRDAPDVTPQDVLRRMNVNRRHVE
jgi:hypothetical protein